MTSALATGPAPQRRRLSGDERRRAIVDGAAERFAEAGFATSTRALAEGMGVTQALLYRYFDSKEALIEAVFQAWFLERDQRGDPRVLQDRSHPLAERLGTFYGDLFARLSEIRLRLFLRAALDQLPLPARYASHLDRHVLWPVLGALRAEAGLPDLMRRPPRRGERELAMMLHGSVVFVGIRAYIYRMPMVAPIEELIALQTRVYVPGALEELRRLQSGDPGDPLGAVLEAP